MIFRILCIVEPRMTVRSIIAEPLVIYNRRKLLDPPLSKLEIEHRVEELMERVGLSKVFKNRYPHEFSGGQRENRNRPSPCTQAEDHPGG